MKWDEIKEKYPKCCRLSWNYQILDFKYGTDRRLYDFFDEQGINVSVNAFLGFDYRIYRKADTLASNEITFTTRIEAEEKAFEKAFGILEDKL